MDHDAHAFAAALPFQSITMIARLHASGSHQQQHLQHAASVSAGGDFFSAATGIHGVEFGPAAAPASSDGGVNNTAATTTSSNFVPPPPPLLTKTTTTTMTSIVEGEATVLPTTSIGVNGSGEEEELLVLLLRQANRRSSWRSNNNNSKKRKEPTSDTSLPFVTAPTRRPRSTSNLMLSATSGRHAAAIATPLTTRLPTLPQLNVASIFAAASGTGGVGVGGVSFLADYLSGSGRGSTSVRVAAPPTVFPPFAVAAGAAVAKRRRSDSLSELSSDEEPTTTMTTWSLPDVAIMSSSSITSLPLQLTADGGASSPQRRPNTLEDSLNVMVATNSTGSTSIQNNLKLIFVDHNNNNNNNKGSSSGSLVRSISR